MEEKRVSKKQVKKIHTKYYTFFMISLFLNAILFLITSYTIYSSSQIKKKTIAHETTITNKLKANTKALKNYLFLGDSITDFYDLDKYYPNLPVVNSGINGNTTDDILSNMKERVYRYNPSKVFILIGTNDIRQNKSVDEIVANVEKIVKEIRENRSYADIYLESIYPVNRSDANKIDLDMVANRKNSFIKKINVKLKDFADNTKKVTYVNMYDKLLDGDELNLDYTKEGLHLNDNGYEVVTKTLKKYMEE